MGADQWIEEETTQDLAHTLMEKKEKGFTVMGIETLPHARPYSEVSWTDNTIVVFGNEEYGIASHVLKTCDAFANIPMFGRKNSINVANAVSVICFQIACTLHRQFQ
jgi:tRNA G18 (ribose-2'-O)-methylase SpoU